MNDTTIPEGIIIFDPQRSVRIPFTSRVEFLLGGVPVVMYPDGTEQFLDSSEEPENAYSPKLPEDQLEAFCKEHLAKYEAFNAEHGSDKLMSERIPMPSFWR